MGLRTISQHLNSRIDQVVNFTHGERAMERVRSEEFHSQTRRMILYAILATPGLPDFIYQRRVVRPYAAIGREVLGTGAHSITLSDGANVQKILRGTRGLSEEHQRAEIDKLEFHQEISLRYLEQFTPTQTFGIESDPLCPDQPVVVARQRRINGISATPIFYSTAIQDKLALDFVHASYEMLGSEQALPDLAGDANIIQNDDGLHMVDTICVRGASSDQFEVRAFDVSLNVLRPHFDQLDFDDENQKLPA